VVGELDFELLERVRESGSVTPLKDYEADARRTVAVRVGDLTSPPPARRKRRRQTLSTNTLDTHTYICIIK